VVTLGAGKALAPVASKLTAPLKTAAGNATGKIASSARSAISRFKGGCSSFSGATAVLMADGTEKSIEDVQVGDKVLATDPETGEQVAKEVTAVWVHDDTLVNLDLDGESITTTEDHPFYNVTDGDFQWASELTPGDQVLTDTGRLVTVHGIDPTTAYDALAYNLTVEGIHTYHVGETHILVHNTLLPGDACGTGTGPADKPIRAIGPWTLKDIQRGAFGLRPKQLGDDLEVHHADQMPGSPIHELNRTTHRGPGTDLHRNKWNQGVTAEMRTQDTQLHWWYRSMEQGWDAFKPSLWFGAD
jgi:hypothetical protein